MSWPNLEWTSFTSVPPPSGSSAVGTRKRVGVACTLCRSRKVKCSGKAPCTRCASLGTSCTFEEVPQDLKQAAFARKERRKAVIQAEKAAAALTRTQVTIERSVNRSDDPVTRSSSPTGGSSPPQRFYNLRTRRNALVSSACLGLSPTSSTSSTALNLSEPAQTGTIYPTINTISTPLSYLPIISSQNVSSSAAPMEKPKVPGQTLLRPALPSKQHYLNSHHSQLTHSHGYLTPPIMPLVQPPTEAYFERISSSSSNLPSMSPEPLIRSIPTRFISTRNEPQTGMPLTPLDQRPEDLISVTERKRVFESNRWTADQPLLKMRRQAVCLGPAIEVDQIEVDSEHFGIDSVVIEQSGEWLKEDVPEYSITTKFEESCQSSNLPWVPSYISSMSGA